MNISCEIKYVKDSEGRSPFLKWLEDLKDKVGRARIRVAVDRLERGNFGNCRSLGEGLHELKIDFGPGYRVYFGVMGQQIVVILCGGSKRTQSRDIEKALEYWTHLKEVM